MIFMKNMQAIKVRNLFWGTFFLEHVSSPGWGGVGTRSGVSDVGGGVLILENNYNSGKSNYWMTNIGKWYPISVYNFDVLIFC